MCDAAGASCIHPATFGPRARARSVTGRPALREEFTHPDGRRWVSWYLELDGVPFVVTGTEGHGVGYEDLRMAVDLIATTARTDD